MFGLSGVLRYFVIFKPCVNSKMVMVMEGEVQCASMPLVVSVLLYSLYRQPVSVGFSFRIFGELALVQSWNPRARISAV